jgi:hypothetical protein
MRKAMLLLAVLGSAGLLRAQSPFGGTWTIDLSQTRFPDKPQTAVLNNGAFQFPTCDPEINMKAGGADRLAPGSKTCDTLAVKAVDGKTVAAACKKGGKVVETGRRTVSADGKTITLGATPYPGGNKQPVTLKETLVRVAASGSWRTQRANASENTLTRASKSTADGMMMTNPAGESFNAKFDGKGYPIKGNPNYTMVSLTKANNRSFDETVKRDGRILSVAHRTVSVDGKTMSVKVENKVQGTTGTLTEIKQ